MNKINLYVFSQIVKSCTLVFFIFISIAWLMQISRLFSIMDNLQIDFMSIFSLSLWLIPNIINVTLPFIIIFGLVLAFLKFHRDKEIIAIFSLGLSTYEIKKPIFMLSVFALVIYILTNLFFSPIAYEIYKKKEFEIRNNIDFNKINISNFIELDNKLIVDFKKNNSKFEDVLINFKNANNNFNYIYAKEGIIEKNEGKLIFILFKGFKLVIKENEIEKLKFDNYKIEFPNITNPEYNNFDKNTLTINDLLKENDRIYKEILTQRVFDILIVISFILYFYFFIIKKNNYSIKNLLIFIILAILVLTTHNLISNNETDIYILFMLNFFNLILIHILGSFLTLTKFNE